MSANTKIVNSVPLLTCAKEGQQHSAHLFEILLVRHTRAQGATTPQQAFVIDQWHLRRDAATIQRNTCELRCLKQHNIKNLFLKLTWTLRICHFRRSKSTKTNRAWLTPWQQHVLQDTGQLCDWSLIAMYDGLAQRFFVLQFFDFSFYNFLVFGFSFFLVLQFLPRINLTKKKRSTYRVPRYLSPGKTFSGSWVISLLERFLEY